ncbi:MAG: hypothetical protein ABI180_10070 [Microcoleus sp.]
MKHNAIALVIWRFGIEVHGIPTALCKLNLVNLKGKRLILLLLVVVSSY